MEWSCKWKYYIENIKISENSSFFVQFTISSYFVVMCTTALKFLACVLITTHSLHIKIWTNFAKIRLSPTATHRATIVARPQQRVFWERACPTIKGYIGTYGFPIVAPYWCNQKRMLVLFKLTISSDCEITLFSGFSIQRPMGGCSRDYFVICAAFTVNRSWPHTTGTNENVLFG